MSMNLLPDLNEPNVNFWENKTVLIELITKDNIKNTEKM